MNVCVVTGTRADYGIYYPLLQKLQEDDSFELKLLVTGMHLSPYYGNTLKEVEKDGFEVAAKVDILIQGATGGNMARSVGLGIMGMTQAFESMNPDLIIVLGDRGEMLAATISASHLNIPVAHIHGGEVSGSIDESVRHAITKLSHLHFTSTTKSAERITKLGEEPWRIHTVGAPRIDTIMNTELPKIQNVFGKYNIEFLPNDYLLFVFHPVSTEVHDVGEQVENCMNVLVESKENIIVILPNSDAGNDKIFEVYERFGNNSKFNFITNFSPVDYLTVLKHAKGLVGNSSSGIIEAASFHVPVLNIGTRQNGRDRSANVIDVSIEKEEIAHGLKKITSEDYKKQMDDVKNIYGDGSASQGIIRVLKEINLEPSLLNKKITY